ncbi:GDSL esterase/lipase At1g29670 [Vigna radiata var. radiata]|uniref:GDSL esterase/lipase At1g29670 n=1 Tax=Vigna radiata var. radiata TaxID=3916 RepID=A0A1S3VI13_VIGRR|nr:GDSL esterase/lipase At1g29670 [Vigna radiata var. radiata]
MAIKTKASLLSSILLLLANCMQHCVNGQQVPCFFVFGDSLCDNGNNNNLPTAAKSNYNPYGIDFPGGASGRFTNGQNLIDYLAQLLEFPEYIPPFANTNGSDILKGVNYASGAAGILFETGKRLGDNIHLEKQLENHRAIYLKIARQRGGLKNAKEYLNQCLYYVNIGSNDYINNFFLPEQYPSSRIYNLERYTNLLISKLSQYLEELHERGARKVAVAELGSLGCTPQAISTRGTNGNCVAEFNDAAELFNNKLSSAVNALNNKFPDSKFIVINSSSGPVDQFGITVVNAPCCPTRGDGQCVVNGTPCPNRNQYLFYDGYHITQLVHQLFAFDTYNQIQPLLHH